MLLNKPWIGTHKDNERGESQNILGERYLKQLKKISKTWKEAKATSKDWKDLVVALCQ